MLPEQTKQTRIFVALTPGTLPQARALVRVPRGGRDASSRRAYAGGSLVPLDVVYDGGVKALRAAIDALKIGDRPAALVALLEAWRSARSPAIADAIDRLSAELVVDEKPIGTKREWEAAFDAARPAAFGRLLAALPTGLDRGERLARLRRRRPDPRVGTVARSWLEDPPVTARQRGLFFPPLIELLAHTNDVRLAPVLAAMTTREERAATIRRIGSIAWRFLLPLASALASTRVRAIDPALLAELTARVDVARPTASVADPAVLHAAVLATPDDDRARAVLGDLLQQKGDPRGEFIALQLARAGTDRAPTAAERKLEKTWGREWLGAIEPSLLKAGVVFERGFVARGRYSAEFHEGEEWSTLTHLDLGAATRFGKSSLAVLSSPNLRSLRHVTAMNPADVETLGVTPWQTVGFLVWGSGRHFDYPFVAGPGTHFPAVTKLVVAQTERKELEISPSVLAAMLGAWPNVDELEIDTSASHVGALAPRLRRSTVHTRDLSFTVDRAARDLTVEFRRVDATTSAAILSVLRSLDGIAARVTLRSEGALTLEGDLLSYRKKTISLARLRAATTVVLGT